MNGASHPAEKAVPGGSQADSKVRAPNDVETYGHVPSFCILQLACMTVAIALAVAAASAAPVTNSQACSSRCQESLKRF